MLHDHIRTALLPWGNRDGSAPLWEHRGTCGPSLITRRYAAQNDSATFQSQSACEAEGCQLACCWLEKPLSHSPMPSIEHPDVISDFNNHNWLFIPRSAEQGSCECLFPGVLYPGYISATIFISVIWNLDICLGFLSYFFHQLEKRNLEIKPTTSLWIQDKAVHLYLAMVLLYLCLSLKNLLGPIIALKPEVVGFLSLYSVVVISGQCLMWKIIDLHASTINTSEVDTWWWTWGGSPCVTVA